MKEERYTGASERSPGWSTIAGCTRLVINKVIECSVRHDGVRERDHHRCNIIVTAAREGDDLANKPVEGTTAQVKSCLLWVSEATMEIENAEADPGPAPPQEQVLSDPNLLRAIFSSLGSRSLLDLLAWGGVCRAWRAVVASEPEFWSDIDVKRLYDELWVRCGQVRHHPSGDSDDKGSR